MKRLLGPNVVRLGLVVLGVLAATAAYAQESKGEPERPESSPMMGGNSFLGWMVEASGPIGIVLLLMSIYMVAVIAWMLLEYRRSKVLPEALIREVNDHLTSRRFPQAYERLAGDPSMLGRVASAGVRRLGAGPGAAYRAMQMASDDATMEMEHRTTYLATIGTLGPLIGLLGTVYGMIISFRVMSSEGTPDATLLAGGISTALFATLEGIFVAIPAIAAYAFFRNRIARLSMEVELTAEGFLEQFAPGVRSPHPLAAGAGPRVTAQAPGPAPLVGPYTGLPADDAAGPAVE